MVKEKRKHSFSQRKHKYQWQAILWLLLPLGMLILFSYYPPIQALIDSFFDTQYDSTVGGYVDVFVGFRNYSELFNDKVFWVCIKNVLIFTGIGLVLGNFMTIFLAELLFNLKNKKLSSFFRVLFIIPILVPSIVILLIWKYAIFGNNGLMNEIIVSFGGERQLWYWDSHNEFIGKFAIIFTNFPWVGGTAFLIYLAGLQNISPSVMEASQLDKCNVFKRIFKIDLPLIASQLKYFLIMGVIGGFQNFDLQLIVIGSEYDNTNVLGLYLYDRAFGQGYVKVDGGQVFQRFGYASAVGMIILAVTLVLTIANMQFNKERKPKNKKRKSITEESLELRRGE